MNKLEKKSLDHAIDILRDTEVALDRLALHAPEIDDRHEIAKARESIKKTFQWLVTLSRGMEEEHAT